MSYSVGVLTLEANMRTACWMSGLSVHRYIKPPIQLLKQLVVAYSTPHLFPSVSGLSSLKYGVLAA
eukprot:5034034-Amphidinium_carterae.2